MFGTPGPADGAGPGADREGSVKVPCGYGGQTRTFSLWPWASGKAASSLAAGRDLGWSK